MTENITRQSVLFPDLLRRSVVVKFDQRHGSSDVSVRRRPVDFSVPFAQAVQRWGSCWPFGLLTGRGGA